MKGDSKSLLVLLVVLLLLLSGLPASAQEWEIDDRLDACTNEELLDVLIDGSDLMPRLGMLALRAEPGSSAFALMEELDLYYLIWWRDVQPTLPDCAFSLRYQFMISRSFSHLYTTLLWIAFGDDARVNKHLDLFEATSEEVELVNEALDRFQTRRDVARPH